MEFVLAGDAAGAVLLPTNDAGIVGGDGAVRELWESRWRWPLGKGDGGAKMEVGVGTGVFWLEPAAATAAAAARPIFGGPSSPVYTVPNSPGAKVRVEQNPSDEEINNVLPSLDLRVC